MSRGITAVAAAAIAAAALAGCVLVGVRRACVAGRAGLVRPAADLGHAALAALPVSRRRSAERQAAAVREPAGAARLRRPVRPQDHPGAVGDPGHRAGRPAAGRAAGQSGRSWRQRPVHGGQHGGRPRPAVAAEYDIVGFDTRGVGSSVPALSCDPSFFSRPRPGYVPPERSGRAGAGQPGEAVRGRLREAVRLAAAVHDHRGPGQGHGLDPGRARAAADQLLRRLLRHLPRPGVRDAVPAPDPPDGAGQRGRSGGRLVRRQHRPGLRLPGPDDRVLRLDRPATTPSSTSAPPRPR